MKIKLRLSYPCLVLIAAISVANTQAQQSPAEDPRLGLEASQTPPLTAALVSLFTTPAQSTPVADRTTSMPSGFPPALRSRSVALIKSTVSREGICVGLRLKLDLFSDAVYTARVDRVTENMEGTVIIRGRIEGYPLGTVILTTSRGRTLGLIDMPELGKNFSIQNEAGSEVYHLIDVDLARVDKLEGAPSLVPPVRVRQPPLAADKPKSDPTVPVTVDVMIVYTPAARIWADANGGGIANVIAQAMAQSQLVLDNNDTLLTLNLVHSTEIEYTETDSSFDLARLTNNNDGYMDAVHSLRNLYGADLVVLLANVSFAGGQAWALSSTAGDPASAFSLNRVQQSYWGFTMVHEMGHNMGCGHAKAQNYQPGPGLFTYSAGWRWTGSDNGKYCSVMTYEAGAYFADGITHTRVAYFSSPLVQHLEVATGNAVDGDNARTVRETKGVVAAYRFAPPANDNFANSATISNNSGTVIGNTTIATVESDEPAHASWGPYKSVWYSFTPASSGILTIDTHGSAFDTVLAIYTGSTVGSLTHVASSDDDELAGNSSGLTAIPLSAGTTYRIAVAGYDSTSSGSFALNWTFTQQVNAIAIVSHPQSVMTNFGYPATFDVTAAGAAPLYYQWQKNSSNIVSANSANYTINPVKVEDAGNYRCIVSNMFGVVTSAVAWLTIIVDDFTYETNYPNTNTVTITGYTGSGGAIVIPSTIGGKPVTTIKYWAFSSCPSLTSVTIGKNVTSIESGAFECCSNLTSVTIGKNVTSIADSAFSYCTSLSAITVDALNSVYSSLDGVLFNKIQTTLIYCPNGKTGGVTIPDSVINIGAQAFSYCSGLTSVTIPNSVTSIGSRAFSCCIGLTSVTIPDSITSIESGAFGGCTNLTSVTIGNKVTSIGDNAFGGCNSLTSVIIPASVTSIGYSAFTWCERLIGIFFLGNAPSIGSTIFYGDYNLTVYYMPGTTGWGPTFDGRPAVLWNGLAVITTQPQSRTNNLGSSASFTVVAMGSTRLFYQWQKNSANIGLATNATYTIGLVVTDSEGDYRCLVSNTVGVATSIVAKLSVNVPPVIMTDPQSLIRNVGESARFIVSATGTAPLNYQWHKNGVVLGGATDASYTIAVLAVSDAGNYRCLAANMAGVATSAVAVLTVNAVMSPSAPTSVSASDGAFTNKVRITWNAVAEATGYQIWRNTSDNSAGATQLGMSSGTTYDDTLALTDIRYYYWLKATNAAGTSGFSTGDRGYRANSPSPAVTAFRAGDFDGDGKADPVVFTADGHWHIWMSSGSYAYAGPYRFTVNGNVTPAPADFDGDRRADPAVYTTDGNWYIWLSTANYSPVGPFAFGAAGYLPAPGDFDGDGKADPAVYFGGSWVVWMSSANYAMLGPIPFDGVGYTPVPGDFDGDSKADPAVYVNHNWGIWMSSQGYEFAGPYQFGVADDCEPVPADFDGDVRADPAMVASGNWYIWFSSIGYQCSGPYTFTVP